MIEKWYFAHSSLNRLAMRKTQLQLEKELNIKLINPFYDVEKIPTPVSIVNGDLRAIKNSKGVIAIIDDKITIGTYMEIFFNSYILKRPTFVVIWRLVVFGLLIPLKNFGDVIEDEIKRI